MQYQHFYLLMKFALNRQLRRLRPFYFSGETEDGLEQRLQCASPLSNLVSSVKLHICAILSLIYDYYQMHILQEYWDLCNFITSSIVTDD